MSALFYRDGGAFSGEPKVGEKGRLYAPPVQLPCYRCGGAGGADKWAHTGWKCYDCGGSGLSGKYKSYRLYTAEQLEKLNAAKAKRDATAAAKRAEVEAQRAAEADATRAEFVEEYRPLFELANVEESEFVSDVIETAKAKAHITDRQIEVIENHYCRSILRRERRERAHHVGEVGDRIEVTGTVERAKSFDSQFQYGQIFWVVTILSDDGALLLYKGGRNSFGGEGDRVTFKATVKAHDQYRGEPQTVIQRASVSKYVPAEVES